MNKLLVVLLVIINCLIGAFGAIYLKKGSTLIPIKKNKNASKNINKDLKNKFPVKHTINNFLHNKNLLFGIILYAISAIFTVLLLKYNNLNLIYPLTSIAYVFIILLSSKMLNENITKSKWLAIILIIIGNILITI
jgi:drug/metabolite transporter (DMT)-like permease